MKEILAEQFKIISADFSHLEFLSTFGRASFIDAYRCTLPLAELRKYADSAFSPARIHEEIRSSDSLYFVCQDTMSTPIGYAKLQLSAAPECIAAEGSVELQRLYVKARFRGRGIGRKFLSHCEAIAMERGLHTIWLRVWEGNIKAQRLYSIMNYSATGKGQYRVGDEERIVVIMQKLLGRS